MWVVRIAVHGERPVGRADVGRTSDGEVVISRDRIHPHVVRQRPCAVGAQEIGYGHPIREDGFVLVLRIGIASEHLQRAGRMPAARVRHGTEQCEFVRDLRVAWQQLGNLHARNTGGNRIKDATKFAGGVGLGIVGFQMRSATAQPHENHRGPDFRLLSPRPRPQLEQSGQR